MLNTLKQIIEELKEDRDIARAEMLDNFKKSDKLYNYYLGKETAISLLVIRLENLFFTENENGGKKDGQMAASR